MPQRVYQKPDLDIVLVDMDTLVFHDTEGLVLFGDRAIKCLPRLYEGVVVDILKKRSQFVRKGIGEPDSMG